jgi:uncharacterized protein YggE
MKKVAIIALVGVLGVGALAAAGAAEDAAGVRTITATGTGDVKGTPDSAEVTLKVVTEAVTADSALRDNRRVIESLVRRLADHGVSPKEVQPATPQVAPQYDESFSDVGERELSGYRVTSKVRVTVRRLDRLGRVIDDAAGAGAKLVGDVTYSVGDAPSLVAEAGRKALADARRKAKEYANAAGMELGEVLHIEDQKPAEGESRDTYGKSTSPDERDFRAKVTVTFAAKQSRSLETIKPPPAPDAKR